MAFTHVSGVLSPVRRGFSAFCDVFPLHGRFLLSPKKLHRNGAVSDRMLRDLIAWAANEGLDLRT
jgi:hypothetical protein